MLTFSRTPESLKIALRERAELQACREALKQDGWGNHPDFTSDAELKSGAKLFVPPHLVRSARLRLLCLPCRIYEHSNVTK